MSSDKRILIALTSCGRLGDTGRSTGFYISEAAHMWQAFVDVGYPVDLVSPQGGQPPQDEGGYDPADPIQKSFVDTMDLSNTLRAQDVDPSAYVGIAYVGGHGTMWDFPDDTALADIARDIYEAGGVVAAVCHGPAGLVNITLSDGSYLVAGKEVSAFTNEEEAAVGLAEVVPFLLQSELEARGAKHSGAPNFDAHVVSDRRLVTGQNPASARGVGEAAVAALAG